MTVEQIELRKILTQMLADNGINRETIADITREIIGEKVERSVENIVGKQTNMDNIIQRSCREMTEKYVKSEAYCHARNAFQNAKINVDVHYSGLDIDTKPEIESKLTDLTNMLDDANCDISKCRVLLYNLAYECLELVKKS